MKTLLVTGGAGFIGANYISKLLDKKIYKIINVDLLTYAANIKEAELFKKDSNYLFIKADIADARAMEKIFAKNHIDAVVAFAAESHVDRSISNPRAFLDTNIIGTYVLLEMAKKYKVEKFIQVSTDEVYGSLSMTNEPFTETSPILPNSPYSASKAAGDALAHAYYSTFGVPVCITRCSNNFGVWQHSEKFIPTVVRCAMENKPIPVYGDGLQIRDWLFVLDHCEAINLVLEKGVPGEIYNIGGSNERTNIELVKIILKLLDKPETLISHVTDRLGHDKRYAINSCKIQEQLYWKPRYDFNKALAYTVGWYMFP